MGGNHCGIVASLKTYATIRLQHFHRIITIRFKMHSHAHEETRVRFVLKCSHRCTLTLVAERVKRWKNTKHARDRFCLRSAFVNGCLCGSPEGCCAVRLGSRAAAHVWRR